MSSEVRFRVPLPFVIPLGALLLIAVVTIGMSRILLSVPKEVAVIIAIAVAMNVLIACAVIANRPDTARRTWPELVMVFAYPILIGIVLTQLNLGTGHGAAEEAGAQEAAEGAGAANSVSAEGVQFNTDELTLSAGEETSLQFSNADSVQHNIAIYEQEGGEELFVGDIIAGGSETAYEIPALDKGEYYFQCDVHPGMNGAVIVE
ncbi:MAG: cupredoxin domain-containing protein [Actinomycetota bacterium]